MNEITTLAEAEAALTQAIADYEADSGRSSDDVWYDLVVATAFRIVLEDPEGATLAREFCRTRLGQIPHDLEPYLGKKDWIDG